MKSKFGLFFFLLAILFAGTAAYMAVNVVDSYREVGVVYKANNEIPAYHLIGEKDVSKQEVPKAAIDAQAVTDPKQIIGKYSRTVIPLGAIVTSGHMSSTQNGNGGVSLPLTDMKNPNMRAIGIPEDFIHVLGDNIKDNDHLDLIGVFTFDKQSFAKTIAYGVPVIKKNPMDQGGGVVVAVTSEQAELLGLAMNYGKLLISITPYQFKSKPLPGTFLESLYIQGGRPN